MLSNSAGQRHRKMRDDRHHSINAHWKAPFDVGLSERRRATKQQVGTPYGSCEISRRLTSKGFVLRLNGYWWRMNTWREIALETTRQTVCVTTWFGWSAWITGTVGDTCGTGPQ